MFADIGYEETETKGLGWISGKVLKIDNQKISKPFVSSNNLFLVKNNSIIKLN